MNESDKLGDDTAEETSETEESLDESYQEDYAHQEEAPSSKKGIGIFPVLGLSLLAALLGAVGGAYGTHYLFPPANIENVRAELRQDVAQMNAEAQTATNDIRQELSKLETRISQVNSESDFQSVTTNIEERLQTLENRPAPSLPDIDPDTLNALKAAQNDGFNWPETDKIEEQIAALISKTETLETQISSLEAEIDSLETDLNAREARSVTTQAEIEAAEPIGPEFPKQALLDAAKTRAESQGFLSRTLNKHVSVDNPDSPVNLIEKIQTAYEKGDIYTAIKTFDRLPSDIRMAGQDWRDAAERLQ